MIHIEMSFVLFDIHVHDIARPFYIIPRGEMFRNIDLAPYPTLSCQEYLQRCKIYQMYNCICVETYPLSKKK